MAGKDEIACKQGCGKTFTTEGWRVKHELTCNGRVQTRGRIDRLSARRHGEAKQPILQKPTRSEASAGRKAPADLTQRIVVKIDVDVDASEAVAKLRAMRDKLDAAITALEAIA